MLEIKVNENVAYIERGNTDPETTLAELHVACQGVLEDVSKRSNKPYNELVEVFISVLNKRGTSR